VFWIALRLRPPEAMREFIEPESSPAPEAATVASVQTDVTDVSATLPRPPVTEPGAPPAEEARPVSSAASAPKRSRATARPRPAAEPVTRNWKPGRRLLLLAGLIAAIALGVVIVLALMDGPPPDMRILVVPDPAGRELVGASEPFPLEPEDAWTDASRYALQAGYGRLQLHRAAVEKNPVKGAETNADPVLVVRARVQHIGPRGRVRFRVWTGGDGSASKPTARLTDDKGVVYACRDTGPDLPRGYVTAAEIRPHESADTLFLFDPPPASVQSLRLELSGTGIGAPGTLRLEIPRKMLEFKAEK
jgi:hypothetical protein